MKFAENVKKFFEKLQNLPENKKKIILWTIVAITGIIMMFFWVSGAVKDFSKIGGEIKKIKMPEINFSDMPKLDMDLIQTTTPSN